MGVVTVTLPVVAPDGTPALTSVGVTTLTEYGAIAAWRAVASARIGCTVEVTAGVRSQTAALGIGGALDKGER